MSLHKLTKKLIHGKKNIYGKSLNSVLYKKKFECKLFYYIEQKLIQKISAYSFMSFPCHCRHFFFKVVSRSLIKYTTVQFRQLAINHHF